MIIFVSQSMACPTGQSMATTYLHHPERAGGGQSIITMLKTWQSGLPSLE